MVTVASFTGLSKSSASSSVGALVRGLVKSRVTALVLGACLAVIPTAVRADAHAQKSKVRHPIFSGYLASESHLRVKPLARPSGNLQISSVNEPKRLVTVNLYNPDGSYNDSALE